MNGHDSEWNTHPYRLWVLDVDGVLTDGHLLYGPDGETMKRFHVHDGLGIKRIQSVGIEVAIISSRAHPSVTHRLQELGVKCIHQGVPNKLEKIQQLCQARSLEISQHVLYMGDDLPDLPPMEACALSIAPSNAHPDVLAQAKWVTERRGGEGAVREAADKIIKGRYTVTVTTHGGPE